MPALLLLVLVRVLILILILAQQSTILSNSGSCNEVLDLVVVEQLWSVGLRDSGIIINSDSLEASSREVLRGCGDAGG